jgi:DNA ligase D-like protein (predicted 3'-phosphoesterase)
MPKKKELIFVVQEHHATRLHWDFRLEMNGVLKSWAVPKKPPLKQGIKRLAVQVNDHDIGYADFEGEIPKGQYGAGKVIAWDRGTYELIEKTKDKILVDLKGKKLKGRHYLVKFPKAGEKNWLLFKAKQ